MTDPKVYFFLILFFACISIASTSIYLNIYIFIYFSQMFSVNLIRKMFMILNFLSLLQKMFRLQFSYTGILTIKAARFFMGTLPPVYYLIVFMYFIVSKTHDVCFVSNKSSNDIFIQCTIHDIMHQVLRKQIVG